MRKLSALFVVLLVVGAFAVPALANHPATNDSGTDIPNTGSEMNQESFWEDYFDGDGFSVECTKFENHNGSIPSQYEAAVVKSGSELVRVYVDPPNMVIGPANPNNQHPNRRHTAPFSWVMKCNFVQDPTTTTQPEVTTTTVVEEPTTTVVEETTTTTTQVPNETTTTLGQATTTVVETSTTTVAQEPPTSSTVTTTPQPQLTELPFTGMSQGVALFLLGVVLVLGGIGCVALRRADK